MENQQTKQSHQVVNIHEYVSNVQKKRILKERVSRSYREAIDELWSENKRLRSQNQKFKIQVFIWPLLMIALEASVIAGLMWKFAR